MTIPIKTIITNAFNMDYFHFGQGQKVLVILPGLSIQSVMNVAELVEVSYQNISNTFSIYVFDRRKYLPPTYSIQEMASDTAIAIQTLGLEHICVFGPSQGGMIAQIMAIEYPELIDRMVLGSSSANVLPEHFAVIQKWIDLAKKKDKENLYLEFGKNIYPPEFFSQIKKQLIAAAKTVTDEDLERFIILAESMKDFNIVDELSRIKCPVLVIGDLEDAVLDSDASMEIAENLEHLDTLKLYMYPGFGHAAFDTAPDYHQRLLQFFTEE